MAEIVPLVPSEPSQRIELSLGGLVVVLDVRWNALEEAWYLDVFEQNLTPIARSLKIVLGVMLGRRCSHKFFKNRALFAVDSSGTGDEAKLDDLGVRVNLWYFTETDLQVAGGA